MKKTKRLTILPLFFTLALLLSGCVQRTKSGKPYGLIYENLAVPTQHVIEWLSNLFGGSYGWAIITITFIVRMALMPLMLKQSRNATVQQEKMASVKPQLADIQERQKNAQTQAEKAAISQEMMQVYRENGISMTGGIGCLPLLIQMPIFAALYAAIQYSPELSRTAFLGINLGKTSIVFTALTFIIYALQGYLATLGIPPEQKKQMQSMMLISPIMLTGMTFISPAGLGLYFFVGGIFACLQTVLVNLMRPKIREEIRQELEKNPPKIKETIAKVEKKIDAVTNSSKKTNQQSNNGNQNQNRQRNAGKQQRRPK
ncbi:membrane protein insertase YidC [Liquorilactobacillus satsumensis]|uniref:60 kDa inner membrane protein n=1 Tax=Liquorilactobacillus satsumensis DSM 16230 = JCM 12392 TaxID=1423801 RepID=A0A0R1V3K3_9LACO|nr:membrane protein insertase YidC [Liquorilactobacillus satsumensis]KRL98019.1 60 kDa inner membrane protein [Liquorilactobacillus satsumensis DSM 16230 = JCM 12392]MCC7667489.1 OxaA precursor [Liquorilactobacillus satsumensis]MCP9312316.1 membrane protein insertase YidC [Liquorilactobacillus satsumensis]MCP9327709.1 membrane protein insertase YidC [Liquorilactobacillus satsumensis]MCP9357020.1 membrane protein insertase YidC [Liquorilactobacillus satsumensis]